eukprot:UN21907
MLLNIDLGISDFSWDSHGKLFFPRGKFLNALKKGRRVKMMCQFERHYESIFRIEVRKPTSFVSDDKSRVPQESFIMSSSSVSHNPICSQQIYDTTSCQVHNDA